jgi:hypothetical protein
MVLRDRDRRCRTPHLCLRRLGTPEIVGTPETDWCAVGPSAHDAADCARGGRRRQLRRSLSTMLITVAEVSADVWHGEEFECARSSVDRAENGEPVPVGSCDRVLRAAHVLAGQNGLPACPVSSLRLLPTRGSPSMTGEMAAIFILLDRSTTTCAVGGYPNIALYTARGERLPFRFRDAAGRT